MEHDCVTYQKEATRQKNVFLKATTDSSRRERFLDAVVPANLRCSMQIRTFAALAG
jgi:hypothetical protein